MKKRYWIPLIVVLAAAGAGAYFYFAGRARSIDYIIRRQLGELSELASKKSGDKLTTGLLKSRKAGSYFADPSRLEFNAGMFSGNFSRERIINESAKYRMFFKQAKLRISDLQLTVVNPETVRAEFAATLTGTLKSGDSVAESRDMASLWKREPDGRFRLVSLVVHDVVEK